MTAARAVPSDSTVRQTLERLRQRTAPNPVAARDLATELGIPNSTFWRHFPDIAQEVSDQRKTARRGEHAPSLGSTNGAEDAALRRQNAALRREIRTATAVIVRLTLENRQLQDEVNTRAGIVRLNHSPESPKS